MHGCWPVADRCGWPDIQGRLQRHVRIGLETGNDALPQIVEHFVGAQLGLGQRQLSHGSFRRLTFG
jgi:hypothetical protein